MFTEIISGAGVNVSESRSRSGAKAVVNGLGTRYRISGMREGSTEWSGIKLVLRVCMFRMSWRRGMGKLPVFPLCLQKCYVVVLGNYPVVM